MINLEQQGYQFDRARGIWLRPDYQGLAYSDGDESEARVARIIREAEDLSVLSAELSRQCTDWASLYHLGAARGNILRPFEHCLSGRILEIGAGCGAISRYLGECGGSVLSLEGSVRRAQIAASRTRDMDNVLVMAERFDDFETDERFDVITLIGVLEYASVFSHEADAALDMLKGAISLLKPDGKLFLAIENQLGLKYFAGAPEDHLSVPMYGIEGRYIKGQPQTFGRQKLESLIQEAGFDHSEFFYPAPDYKLPYSITTQQGFDSKSFDAAALAWQSVKRDPQLPDATAFNLERAWPVVIENGLGMELANSFLVVASRSAAQVVAPDILAYHYNTSRKPEFCKVSRFVQAVTGIEVHHTPLVTPSGEQDEGDFRHVLSGIDPYVSGEPLSKRFLNIATTPDWKIQDFALFIGRYLDTLKSLLRDQGLTLALEHINERLPGIFIDAVPNNILVTRDGTPVLIDVEWEVRNGVELGHLLLRSLLLLIANATPFYPGIMPPSRRQFVMGSLRLAGLSVSERDIDRYIAREALFQSYVTDRAASEFMNWQPDEPINKKTIPVQTPTHAKLYYSDEDGQFKEHFSLAVELQPGQQQLTYCFSQLTIRPKRLRFDPVDQKVSFSLGKLRLLNDEKELWRWDGQVQSLVLTSGLMKVEKSGGPVFFLSLDDDPYLELPVDLSLIDDISHVTLAVELGLYTDEVMARLISVELNEVSQYQHEFRSALVPLSEQIRTLTLTMGELDKVTHSLADSVFESEHETIETIERLLSQHTEVANDRKFLIKDLESAHLKQQGEKDEQIYQLNRKVTELESALVTQQVEKDTHIHHLNLRVGVLESSYSRKLTAPIRGSFHSARRLKRFSQLLPSIVRRGGGLKATTRKAINVLRSQGVSGLLTRLRWFNDVHHVAPSTAAVTQQIHDRHDYTAWIERYDTLDAQGRWQITEHIRTWTEKPLISIIMPVFDPPIDLLRQAIDSVRYQLYPNWELCIADDASTQPAVREFLEHIQRDDPQIHVVFREQNGHISAASNSAIAIAQGQYLALMDNDDLIPEHALYWVARALVENPDAGLIYSDEDKIDTRGRRSEPYFKPDWNEFLFRSQNMISHLGVYRRDLVEEVGGFRVGFEGSQDYDLALRCVELLKPAQIIHIPRVLYHWRIRTGSTAMATNEKPYAVLAGVKALDEHLQRKGIAAHTELLPIGMYRVHYQLPEHPPLVSLIIPTRNAWGLVKQCIDSIQKLTLYKNYEIILVDNGSDEADSLDYFAQLKWEPNIRVLRDDGPFNYSALNNHAVQQARGEVVGLINNDIEVINPQWLDEMVSIVLQPNVGAVGARLWFADDRLQHGGVILGVGGIANHSHKLLPKGEPGYFGRAALIQSLSAVTAACLIIRKSVYEEVNGLDEINLKIAFNDVDFCLRVQEAGYTNVWTPFAELYHHESATRGLEDTPEKQERFSQEVDFMQKRWPNIRNDGAYNPNLSLDHHDFGLAWPPRI
ncbi:MAG TPA: glycosyltransferase [Pseudomonas sp.]|jgi:glycosyltransferase involved in cell wall biosynthesis/SAM-dependent methyltransferase|uniref:glycosyltransferase n=1 Tax=Pseudomonas sp. TaxID=306 RepID=UPI002ED90FD6